MRRLPRLRPNAHLPKARELATLLGLMTEPSSKKAHYPEVPAQANFPAIEAEILQRWQHDGTFQKSVDQRAAGENEFVFYDGPPFANGLPHYGHLLTGFV